MTQKKEGQRGHGTDRSTRTIHVTGNASGPIVMGDANHVGTRRAPKRPEKRSGKDQPLAQNQTHDGDRVKTTTIAGVVSAVAAVVGVIIALSQLQPCSEAETGHLLPFRAPTRLRAT